MCGNVTYCHLSVLWLIPIYGCQPMPPEVLQTLSPPSTQTSPAVTLSSHWPFRHWAHSTLPLLFSFPNLVDDYLNPLETHVRQLFCFSDCQSVQRFNTVLIKRSLIYQTANRTSGFSSFASDFKL